MWVRVNRGLKNTCEMKVIHKAVNHPGRGGCLFEAELERVGAEKVYERASYPLKSSVEHDEKKRQDKGMAALHCRHLEDRKLR